MEILLIRHGDPDYAHDSLTPRGVGEARQLAAALLRLPLDELYVSPLGRALETCAFTAEAKSMEPITLDWLRERGIKRGPVYLWEAPGQMFLAPKPLPRNTTGLHRMAPCRKGPSNLRACGTALTRSWPSMVTSARATATGSSSGPMHGRQMRASRSFATRA